MSLAIYDKDTFFETLNRFNDKYTDFDIIKDPENLYNFTTNKEDIDFGRMITLSISEGDKELFTFSMTKYDKEEFIKQVKQPFMWDSDARNKFEDDSFTDFLCEKDLYSPYQIKLVQHGKVLKDEDMNGVNQELEIFDILSNIDFEDLVTSTLYNKNNVKNILANKM